MDILKHAEKQMHCGILEKQSERSTKSRLENKHTILLVRNIGSSQGEVWNWPANVEGKKTPRREADHSDWQVAGLISRRTYLMKLVLGSHKTSRSSRRDICSRDRRRNKESPVAQVHFLGQPTVMSSQWSLPKLYPSWPALIILHIPLFPLLKSALSCPRGMPRAWRWPIWKLFACTGGRNTATTQAHARENTDSDNDSQSN